MTETVRVFVGTDPRMGAAENVLEYTLRSHSKRQIEIHWMRAGDPGFAWNIGRPPGQPYTRPGWATDFTCFRWAVPALAGYQGRAIYLDVDMAVFADIGQVLDWDLGMYAYGRAGGRFDVMVFDCEHERWRSPHFPSLFDLQNTDNYWTMSSLAAKAPPAATLPKEWDEVTRTRPGITKLRHWTNMRTQPWRPWPEAFRYDENPTDPDHDLWWALHAEATRGETIA